MMARTVFMAATLCGALKTVKPVILELTIPKPLPMLIA